MKLKNILQQGQIYLRNHDNDVDVVIDGYNNAIHGCGFPFHVVSNLLRYRVDVLNSNYTDTNSYNTNQYVTENNVLINIDGAVATINTIFEYIRNHMSKHYILSDSQEIIINNKCFEYNILDMFICAIFLLFSPTNTNNTNNTNNNDELLNNNTNNILSMKICRILQPCLPIISQLFLSSDENHKYIISSTFIETQLYYHMKRSNTGKSIITLFLSHQCHIKILLKMMVRNWFFGYLRLKDILCMTFNIIKICSENEDMSIKMGTNRNHTNVNNRNDSYSDSNNSHSGSGSDKNSHMQAVDIVIIMIHELLLEKLWLPAYQQLQSIPAVAPLGLSHALKIIRMSSQSQTEL